MITYELLESRGACEGQVKLFRDTFPEGVEVSVDLCVKYASRFDFNWAGYELLKDTEAYRDARAPLWKAYEDAEAPLWKAYEDARAPLLKAYREGLAKVFAEMYLEENSYDQV